jgi:lysophospholipase L1-like esterase
MSKKVIFIGDSITEAFDVKKHLSEFNIINKGIYGDNTMGVLKRIDSDIINLNPDKVFILIGTNDFALNRTPEELIETYEQAIKKLIAHIHSTDIYITSILPTRNIENRPIETIKKTNAYLFKLAQKYKLNYFDLFSELADKNEQINEIYTTDGLHLSEEGYQKWAEVFKLKFRDLINNHN